MLQSDEFSVFHKATRVNPITTMFEVPSREYRHLAPSNTQKEQQTNVKCVASLWCACLKDIGAGTIEIDGSGLSMEFTSRAGIHLTGHDAGRNFACAKRNRIRLGVESYSPAVSRE